METIGNQKLWPVASGRGRRKPVTCTEIRKSKGVPVHSYMDLAKKIADLQFMNRDFMLLYRGQSGDYRNVQNNTSLKPSLFRPGRAGANPNPSELIERFDWLKRAGKVLQQRYERLGLPGAERLKRQQILRWALLQHYEICATPLLDVTHSLRIAASFATHGVRQKAFLFVLGVPNLSGSVTASAEAEIQIVRLSSVCPPSAVRPHIQEGYLLGEYPDMGDFDQKQYYAHYEIDFGLRLVAKFHFDPRKFWKDGNFPVVPVEALYPSQANDPIAALATEIRKRLG